jgi:hypothetical protein
LLVPNILEYHLIDETIDTPDMSKKLTQQMIWSHHKPLHFYYGDTGYPIKPDEEWGEKAKTDE